MISNFAKGLKAMEDSNLGNSYDLNLPEGLRVKKRTGEGYENRNYFGCTQ